MPNSRQSRRQFLETEKHAVKKKHRRETTYGEKDPINEEFDYDNLFVADKKTYNAGSSKRKNEKAMKAVVDFKSSPLLKPPKLKATQKVQPKLSTIDAYFKVKPKAPIVQGISEAKPVPVMKDVDIEVNV